MATKLSKRVIGYIIGSEREKMLSSQLSVLVLITIIIMDICPSTLL
jgi:hypothetical protein